MVDTLGKNMNWSRGRSFSFALEPNYRGCGGYVAIIACLCFYILYKQCDISSQRLYYYELPKHSAALFLDCPAGPDIIPIVAGVVAGIVLIGLALLLIWKLLMIIHDRREFAKFEKEKMNAKWDTVSG